MLIDLVFCKCACYLYHQEINYIKVLKFVEICDLIMTTISLAGCKM